MNFDVEKYVKLCELSFEELRGIDRRKVYNDQLADYILRLADLLDDRRIVLKNYKGDADSLRKIASNVAHCNDFMEFNVYPLDGIMDFQKSNLCHSKFCTNCQKLVQGTRLANFYPIISDTFNRGDVQLFTATFTMPNVEYSDFEYSVRVMFEAFHRLIRYFSLDGKIRGIDFSRFGYRAALRSFEVTHNNATRLLHPHLHVIFALSPDIDLVKKHTNCYSFNHGVFDSKFSDFEIFLQRLWRLIIERIRERDQLRTVAEAAERQHSREMSRKLTAMGAHVALTIRDAPEFFSPADVVRTRYNRRISARRITLRDIQALPLGYSCKADVLYEPNFKQAFKYAFKVEDEKNELMCFDTFVTLFDGLFGKRLIQGYGDWYDPDFNDEISDVSADIFDCLIDYLNSRQKPELEIMSPNDTINFAREYGFRVISRKIAQLQLRQEYDEEERELLLSTFRRAKTSGKPLDVMLEEDVSERVRSKMSRFLIRFQKLREIRQAEYRAECAREYAANVHLTKDNSKLLEVDPQMSIEDFF